MTRYATGLIGAFLLFGVACAAAVVPVVILRGRPDRLFDFVTLWAVFGVPSILAMALTVGPVVLGTQRLFRKRIPVIAAAGFGAALGPALLLVSWLLFREGDETFGGLLQFWARLPGEFIVGVLPHSVASAFFAGWLAAGARRPRLTERLPDTPLQPTSGGQTEVE
jgi:hypothetical protein